MVSLDLYRSAEVADRFADGIRDIVAQGKPVAVTEFGAATFRGAADVGANGLDIVEYNPGPIRLTADVDRDEAGQAAYLAELLELFDDSGIDTTFVFLFALYDMPHRADGDPRDDLDLASYGIVAVLDHPGRLHRCRRVPPPQPGSHPVTAAALTRAVWAVCPSAAGSAG